MKSLYLFFTSIFLSLSFLSHAQTITIGTGTSTNSTTGYPAPYGNYYFGARHQFMIRASEIKAAGINIAMYINSLAFNVATIAGTTLNNFEIKIANTTLNAFPTSNAFQSGFTSVFGPVNYADVNGWNTHTFTTPFYWNGISNIIVEVCFNNTAYTDNAKVYYTTASFNSSAYRYADAQGNCTQSSMAVSTKRPNMQLSFISPVPPVASFSSPDSMLVNIAGSIKNKSTDYKSAYWDISGVTSQRFCNSLGCFIDSGTNLNYTFTQPGTYEVKLVVKGFFGTDSIKKTIHVDTTTRKPKANFYLSAYNVGTSTEVLFFDSSQYGAMGWEWSINPPCNGCIVNPYQIPNIFSPSNTIQNTSLFTFDGGIFDVCLKVWNDKGTDTICKKSVLNITSGFTMCAGSDSLTSASNGYIYDGGGPTANYYLFSTGQCKAGFAISPTICSDTITLYVEQFRLRTNDTLEIRDGGTATSPVIKKLSGANLPLASKTVKATSGKMFLRMTTGSGSTSAGDSGFIVRWNVSPAARIISASSNFCADDSLVLSTKKKAGRTYTWKLDDQVLSSFSDTFCIAKTDGTYKLSVSSAGCQDSSRIVVINDPKTKTDFTVNTALQCINNNHFSFSDRSTLSNGSHTRSWDFGDHSTDTDSSTGKTYTNPGIYPVTLYTSTNKGCRDTVIKYVRVAELPAAKIIIAVANDPCAHDSALLRASSILPNKYRWYNHQVLLPDTLTELWVKKTGTYSLRITNDLGCDSLSDSVTIDVRTKPAKPTVTKSGATLKSSFSGSNQWYIANTPIGGATAQYYTPLQEGSYTVHIDSNGCSNISSPFDLVFAGLENIDHTGKAFHIYPNPATTALTATHPDPFTWMITDLSGRTLLSSDKMLQSHQVDLSTLNKGVYFMKVMFRDKTTFVRFEKL